MTARTATTWRGGLGKVVLGGLGWLPAILLASLMAAMIIKARTRPQAGAGPPHSIVSGWRAYATGHRIGDPRADIVITVFTDFQCPFCKRFYQTARQAVAAHPTRVALVVRNYPLSALHPLAMDGAIAAECAAEQGRFADFVDAAYAAQDSLQQKSWAALASRSGPIDTVGFRLCQASPRPRERIAGDVRAGDALGIVGTPLVLVGEEKFAGAVPPEQLDSLIRRLMTRGQ